MQRWLVLLGLPTASQTSIFCLLHPFLLRSRFPALSDHMPASDLMQDPATSAPVAASWHISCSLPGLGSWLHTMPFVSSAAAKTWRTMFCVCMKAPVPEATGIDRCVSGCSCTGWQLQLRAFTGRQAAGSYHTTLHGTIQWLLFFGGSSGRLDGRLG